MGSNPEELRQKATDFIKFAQLHERLEPFNFYFTGSYVLDVMAWPDVDINVRVPTEVVSIYRLGSKIVQEIKPSWFELRHTADEEDSPGAYFLGFETTFRDVLWNVDIWFQETEQFQANRKWLEKIAVLMTPATRHSIVGIKSNLLERGLYPGEHTSMDVYNAVLIDNLRDIESFTSKIPTRD